MKKSDLPITHEDVSSSSSSSESPPAATSATTSTQQQHHQRRRVSTPQFSTFQLILILCLALSILNQFDVKFSELTGYFTSDVTPTTTTSTMVLGGMGESDLDFWIGPPQQDDNDNDHLKDKNEEGNDDDDDDDDIDNGDEEDKEDVNEEDVNEEDVNEEDVNEEDVNEEDVDKDDGQVKEGEGDNETEDEKKEEDVPTENEGEIATENDGEIISENNNGENQQDTTPSSSSSCTFQNSEEWLSGPRISNIDEEEMTDELIEDLILHVSPMDARSNYGSKHVLEQTMCLEDSGFVNWDKDPVIQVKNPIPDIDVDLQEIVFRLMYLAMHEHQYRPAREEALVRYGKKEGCDSTTSSSYTQSLKDSGVGRMDFECPNTKYFVSMAGNLGFGASVRTGMFDPLFFGMSSNRVTLFVNSLKFMQPRFDGDWETGIISSDWLLGSCPRKDMQCMYMPFSPCTPTEQDMINAKILSKQDVRTLRDTGKLPEQYENEKVVVMIPDLGGHKPEPFGLRDRFVDIIKSFYANRGDELKEKWQLDDTTLEKVYDFIKDNKKNEMTDWISRHVALYFILRPNLGARKRLEQEMERILPKDFDSNTAVGFPIRGSDKCNGESECRTFDNYMEMIVDWISTRTQTLQSQNDTSILDKIILTSEDKNIMSARLAYEPKNETFPYEFIVNDEDIGQGTGLPRAFKKGTGDEIMLASLISMKMQLYSESLLLNHCSNFHKLIMDLALHNCGKVKYMEVLKTHDNPDYRIKCKWGR